MSHARPTNWFQRLQERGVIRVALSYGVIAWLLLQIADVTFEPLGVPRWVMVSLIVTALLGLPVAIAFAWFYEVGDQGIERDTAREGVVRPTVTGVRRNADIVIIGVLLAAVAPCSCGRPTWVPAGGANSTIAVLPFQNLSTTRDGEVLALGIAESVLHQIASLAQLDVISRTSSFAFRDRSQDSREIGRQLGARYLLEGSVQSERSQMRVTDAVDRHRDRRGRLVDAFRPADGRHLRGPGRDRAAGGAGARVERRPGCEGAHDRPGYEEPRRLPCVPAGTHPARQRSRRGHAKGNRTLRAGGKLDPGFAAAYVGLAEAGLFVAEYEITADRQLRFEAALRRGLDLVDKALELDPDNGDAYLQRAHLTAFDDLAAAEKDYRRGLELNPNAAKGYAGLAAVVYETPSRRDEALEMLDRARKLDPLEPGHDVTKALFLYMERADMAAANALLLDVVKRYPRYQPALARLCDVNMLTGQGAKSIRYGEQALALDPSLEMTRRNLISAYVDLGDMAAARQLIEDQGFEASPRQLAVLLREGSWQTGRRSRVRLAGGRNRVVHDRDRHERRRDSHACASHGRFRAGTGRARGRLRCALG